MLETVLSRSVRLIYSGGMVIGLGLIAQPALAQQAAGETQRVEITGSNIRRAEAETASAVQTVSREDIEKSGKTTVAELLQTLAVDNQGSVPTSFGSGFAAGASGISLRGLGSASTLVLINGRRVAPYGLADDGQKVFADLNMVPVEAVERVEILKDGASAIYGSDAIAGVVNVILRKDFQGSVGKVTYGQSRYGDGKDIRAAVTHGFGSLDENRFNVLLNFEYGKKGEIWNRDRAGRGHIGRSDLRDMGFDALGAVGGVGAGGTGAIIGNNAAGSAINGNVRDAANNYHNRAEFFPGAACGNFTNHPQGDPGGGCLIDAEQRYRQIQPNQESFNFFGRGTLQLSAVTQAYTELNLYKSESQSSNTPSGVHGNVGFPGGPVPNLATQLGAGHPDNPFATAARLRYLSDDAGPRVSNIDSTFARFVAGLKGNHGVWDYDTAFLYSQNKVRNERTGYLQRDAMRALLDPAGGTTGTAANPGGVTNETFARANSPAYAALPPGTLWRIGENAGLNSRALYAALSPMISNDAKSETAQVDFKASREIGQLAGGPMGIALGTEFRHESVRLDPTSGTDRGNIVGLGYSAYKGSRNVAAVYGEVLAPVLKSLELSGAVRADRYSDVGNSFTPKVGAKWTPVKQFAMRGTYAEGFRAPSPAENGVGGLAAFANATDTTRCDLGVNTECSSRQVAIITSPNRDLDPEKSKSYGLGFVWDPLPRTSLSVDFWEIRRKNEINQEQTSAAITGGRVARDPGTTQAGVAGDPGQLVAVLARYVNSAQTTVRGVDLDFRQGFDMGGGYGKLTFDAKWTHLFKWLRREQDGTEFEFAGTHGNCDVTNCIGTPDDRVNLAATWERGAWRVATIVNYRGNLDNVVFKNDPDGCASHFADGTDAPSGCKVKSFTTVDMTFLYKANDKLDVFGGIQNLFDKIAPLDPLTYGATAYNPLDYSGAVGRFFSVGLRYKF